MRRQDDAMSACMQVSNLSIGKPTTLTIYTKLLIQFQHKQYNVGSLSKN